MTKPERAFPCRRVPCWSAWLAALLPGALPAQTPPNLTAANRLPAAMQVGPAAGTQRNAAMAAGNGASLLVFEDNRAGDNDIFGVRIDAAGQPIDAVPFPITKAPANQTTPKVVWNGQNWLVGYRSEYDPGSGYFATQISAVRVAPQGTVLDANPLVLGNDSTGAYFAIASDGNGWMVAWTGFSAGNSDIRGRRVTAAGSVLDPGGVVLQPASYQLFFNLGASHAGGNYLITWDQSGYFGRRFTSALTPVDPAPVAMAAGQGAIAGNGGHFLCSWIRQSPQFTQEVVAQRFAPDLTALDANPVVLSNPGASPNPAAVSSTWDGTRWLIAWTQPATDARVARFTSQGAVLDPGGLVLPDSTTSPLYAPTLGALPAGGALHLWHEARFGTADDVFAVPVTAAGQAGQERCLSLGAEALRSPRVTAGASIHLVTALAERANGSSLLAWRVDALGQSLDASPLVITSAAHTALQVGGAAWNGAVFLVAWADSQLGQIFARRLHPDGTWIDAAPIAVMLGHTPSVAAAGNDFLVTGLRAPAYWQYVLSFGARVRGSDGVVLDSPVLSLGGSFATRVRAVELGGRWLVATESHFSHDSSQAGVAMNFVDANGVVTTAPNIGIFNIQNWGIVDLASSGTSALVVAQSGSNWSNTEVYAQRLLPNGAPAGAPFVITGAAAMGQSRPSVAWNGREYVVLYETLQNNVWFYDLEPDVHGIRLAESGAPIDATGTAWWGGEDHEVRPDAQGLGGGRALFAASVWADAFAAPRIEVRAQRSPGVSSYGSGTAGCFGPHGLDANGTPTAGSSSFALQCDRGPQNGLGVLALGTASDVAGTDPGLGFLLHLNVQPSQTVVALTMASGPDGFGTVPLQLPVSPTFYGASVFAQGFYWWTGPCQPTWSGFSSSPGLEFRIQAP